MTAPGPAPLRFHFTGAVPDASFYLRRDSDETLFENLFKGYYCHVFAPRQIGKSSLRFRTVKRLVDAGVRCASVDLTSIGTASNAAEWYFALADEIARKLGGDAAGAWTTTAGLPPSSRFKKFMERTMAALPADTRVVVLLDEIESVLNVAFNLDDLFTQLRAMHEERATSEVLGRITFCLIGVTSPNDLIREKGITPYNVSQPVKIEDFTRSALTPLEPGLAHLGAAREVIDAIYAWTSGHPYMTQRLCWALAALPALDEGGAVETVARVVRATFLDRPLEDPNLNYAARRFDDPKHGRADATLTDKVSLYYGLLKGEVKRSSSESSVEMELRLCGMIGDEVVGGERRVRIRNKIVATVFGIEWVRSRGERRFLAESVWNWLDSGKDESFLLRGEALARALAWARSAVLGDDEAALLAESQRAERAALEIRAEEERESVRRAAQQREEIEEATRTASAALETKQKENDTLQNANRTAQRLRNVVIVVAVVVVAAASALLVRQTQAISERSQELKTLEGKLAEVDKQITARQTTLDKATQELADVKAEIAAQGDYVKGLEDKNRVLEDKQQKSKEQIDKLREANDAAKKELDNANRTIGQLKRELKSHGIQEPLAPP